MTLPARVRLVVLYGGQSAEHDVSRVTAAAVLGVLDPDRYDIVPIAITREGQWLAAPQLVAGQTELEATGAPIESGLALRSTADVPVVVLPLLHGPMGEDGTMQGLLELAGVPYVGSGVLGSAMSMDKAAAKEILAFHGIPQCDWVASRVTDVGDDFVAATVARLGFPIFVKPANMGSSVGVSKADNRAELLAAITEAARFDDWLVFEEGVVGHELECAVLGNDDPKASVIGEIRPGSDFYDYDDKYLDGAAELLIPAPIPAPVSDDMRALALRTFKALRCEGLARVDCFWEEGGRGLLVNEVNTIPGFTPISMYPKMWEATGLSYARLIDELVELALERHARRSGRATRR